MLKQKTYKSIILFIILLFTNFINAQVTIGSGLAPNSGALLDLKENNSIGNNSTKGLLLPRVDLTDLKNLYPMFIGDPEYPANKSAIDQQHTGLIVYNTNKKDFLCQGIYVWSGDLWTQLAGKILDILVDPRDGETYPIGNFGNAGTWMLTNLRAKKMPNGTTIEESLTFADDSNPGKYYNYPNKDNSILQSNPEFGLLYNWYAATNGQKVYGSTITDPNQPQVQGVCPKGWHLPSDYEWSMLAKEIGEHPGTYSSGITPDWADSYMNDFDLFPSDIAKYVTAKSVNGVEINGLSSDKCNGGGFNSINVGVIVGGDSYGYAPTTDINTVSAPYTTLTGYWTSTPFFIKDSNGVITSESRPIARMFTQNVDQMSSSIVPIYGRTDSWVAGVMGSVRCKKD